MNPDKKLLKACRKGKRKAQHSLYKLCFPYLMGICIRYHGNEEDALHVLNMAFYKILTKLGQFNLNNSFKAWSRRITINTIISEHRKNTNYKNTMAPTDFKEENGALDDYEFDEINEQIDVDHLKKMIDQLNIEEKTVLNLYVIEGYNHKEIGGMLGIPVGTSKWHLSKARKKLKEKLLNSVEIKKTVLS